MGSRQDDRPLSVRVSHGSLWAEVRPGMPMLCCHLRQVNGADHAL
ncbi:hypothetical protein ABTK62_19990 [Acinetobacter baumannii]